MSTYVLVDALTILFIYVAAIPGSALMSTCCTLTEARFWSIPLHQGISQNRFMNGLSIQAIKRDMSVSTYIMHSAESTRNEHAPQSAWPGMGLASLASPR